MNTSILEADVAMLGKVPLALAMRAGHLRLADGRLTLMLVNRQMGFDATAASLHSVAKIPTGFCVWQGTRRYRLVFGTQGGAVHPHSVLGAAVAAAELPSQLADHPAAQLAADLWIQTLKPLVGSIPTGSRCRNRGRCGSGCWSPLESRSPWSG
jgi:hypothetical protein